MLSHVSFASTMDEVVLDYYKDNIQENVLVGDVFTLLKESNFKTEKWTDEDLNSENLKWLGEIEERNYERFKRLVSHEVSLLAERVKLSMNGGVYNVAFLDKRGLTVASSDILSNLWFGPEIQNIELKKKGFVVHGVFYNKESREFETIAYFELKDQNEVQGYLRISFDSEELDKLSFQHNANQHGGVDG